MSEVHVGVGVKEVDQGLAGVASGAYQSGSDGFGVGGVFGAEGRVRIRGCCVGT